MHENMKNNAKGKGNMDILAYGERNLARNLEENDKKNCCGALLTRRERKSFEKFRKSGLNKSKSIFFFLKPDSRVSID